MWRNWELLGVSSRGVCMLRLALKWWKMYRNYRNSRNLTYWICWYQRKMYKVHKLIIRCCFHLLIQYLYIMEHDLFPTTLTAAHHEARRSIDWGNHWQSRWLKNDRALLSRMPPHPWLLRSFSRGGTWTLRPRCDDMRGSYDFYSA